MFVISIDFVLLMFVIDIFGGIVIASGKKISRGNNTYYNMFH